MNTDTTIQTIQDLVTGLLADSGDAFLVEVRIKPTNNVKVFLDADSGISIDRCVKYNRALYKQIEEKALFPAGEFSLEVSSPGLDEPLKLKRQYRKNMGRRVEVQTVDGRLLGGTLVDVGDETITVEVTEGKGKKAVTRQEIIDDKVIKQTKIVVVF